MRVHTIFKASPDLPRKFVPRESGADDFAVGFVDGHFYLVIERQVADVAPFTGIVGEDFKRVWHRLGELAPRNEVFVKFTDVNY